MVYEMDPEVGYDLGVVDRVYAAVEADLERRAEASNTEPPVLYAPLEVAERWVLVPRLLLRRLQMLGQAGVEISHEQALLFLAELLADGRLIGVKE